MLPFLITFLKGLLLSLIIFMLPVLVFIFIRIIYIKYNNLESLNGLSVGYDALFHFLWLIIISGLISFLGLLSSIVMGIKRQLNPNYPRYLTEGDKKSLLILSSIFAALFFGFLILKYQAM